ncbi:MAG TPA: chemotaxis protein CheW [Chloroflexota bacterium]|nr:chemotaxis protein CheW [Chloroflexota bacterium]
MRRRFVLFQLDQRTFAVEAEAVREVFPLPAISPMDSPSPYVRGAVQLRGDILPVLDLRPALRIRPRPDQLHDVVLAVDLPGGAAGLIVEELSDLSEVPDEEIHSTTGSPLTSASIASSGRIYPVLDLSQVSAELMGQPAA